LLKEAVSSEILAANSFTDKPFMSFAFIEFIIFCLLPNVDLNTLLAKIGSAKVMIFIKLTKKLLKKCEKLLITKTIGLAPYRLG
jgi:hypothetical protein